MEGGITMPPPESPLDMRQDGDGRATLALAESSEAVGGAPPAVAPVAAVEALTGGSLKDSE